MVASSKLKNPGTNKRNSNFKCVKKRRKNKLTTSIIDKIEEHNSKIIYRQLIENCRKIYPSKVVASRANQNGDTKPSKIKDDLKNSSKFNFSVASSLNHPTINLSCSSDDDVICLNETPPKTKVQISLIKEPKSRKNKNFQNLIENDVSLICSSSSIKTLKCPNQKTMSKNFDNILSEEEKNKSCQSDTLETILKRFGIDDTFPQKNGTSKQLAQEKEILNLKKKSAEFKKKFHLKKKEIREPQEKKIFDLLKKKELVIDVSSDEESSSEESEDEEIRNLSDAEMNIYRDSVKGYGGRSLIEKFNYTLTVKDISTLKGLNWLNDEVINFYFELLKERSNNNENLPNIHIMNTYFYSKYLEKGYKSVRRWTKRVNIFEKQLMFIPCHMNGVHWTLCVVNFDQKNIVYYDSMGAKKKEVVNDIKTYLQEEHLDKKKSKIDLSDWQSICMGCDSPQQNNGSDCGVFTCTTAEFISRNAKLTFCQEDMPLLRKTMVVEIVKAKLTR